MTEICTACLYEMKRKRIGQKGDQTKEISQARGFVSTWSSTKEKLIEEMLAKPKANLERN